MIEIIRGNLKMLAMLLPFLLLLAADKKCNFSQRYRCRQYPMPFLTAIFCIVIFIRLDRYLEGARDLLDLIPQWLDSALGFAGGIVPGAAGWLNDLGAMFREWMNSLNLGYWAYYLANTMIMGMYLAFKGIMLGILKTLFRREDSPLYKVSELVYDYDEESGTWYLGVHFGQGPDFMRVMYTLAIVLSCGVMLLTSRFYLYDRLDAPMLPVFSVLVIGEIYFFLDGCTKGGAEDLVGGENSVDGYAGDYSIMRRVLRKLFPDKLNAENTTISETVAGGSTVDQVLTELESSESSKDEIYGRFMRIQYENGMELDRNYLISGQQLLDGESVLFNNPFYYDLVPYIFYPMNRMILRHKKVLVILGRHGNEENILSWCKEGLTAVNHIPDMWRIGVLSQQPQQLDVGIVTRSSVHDLKLHEANSEFFDETEFVVLMEPSRLVTTAQVGLNSLIRYCRRKPKQLVYCSMDKNCDGLLDALSHILMTSLREVSATNHHKGASSYMIWDADDEHLQHRMLPNLSRFLGGGTEMSFAAIKNQVPHASWYGGDAFPVVDIRWIARQYYYDLLHYANMSTEQETMDRVFETEADMWSARRAQQQYLTVEDESFNMFEVKRVFSTRATDQGFVNVMCPDYLLKDYMADNNSIFNADPKAIPYVTADYARTVRNVILRLCLRMSASLVSAGEIAKELMLVDLDSRDPVETLWCGICSAFGGSSQKQSDGGYRPFLTFRTAEGNAHFTIDVLIHKRRFSIESGKMEDVYTITDYRFIKLVLGSLQPAQYIAEDENGQRQYLGSELSGHIYQKYLPGQFFTLGGKYYEMLRVTSGNQVLVRRAADHITGRPSYRQIRSYILSNVEDSTVMGQCRDLGVMRLYRQFADIRVETPAYYRMNRYNDFSDCLRIGINGVPQRLYSRKAILRIDLNPEAAPDRNTVMTLTLLINEVLRTLLAENQDYLAAVTPGEVQIPMTCTLAGEEGFQPREGSIYLIEDIQLDIGILDAVERNLDRIFSIICDYLQWHDETLENSLHPPKPAPRPAPVVEEAEEQRPGFFRKVWDAVSNFFRKVFGGIGRLFKKIADWFRKLFGRKNPEQNAGDTQEEQPQTAEGSAISQQTESSEEPSQSAESRISLDTLGGESERSDTMEYEADDAQRVGTEQTFCRAPYHKRFYLLYGMDQMPGTLDPAGVRSLLVSLGYGNSSLTQARKGKNVAEILERSFVPNRAGVRYCDFCGCELTGLEYDILGDGRERCTNCSRTAVNSLEEFKALHDTAMRNMRAFFGIRIQANVRIQMVNARKLHRHLGHTFVPTGEVDGRILGVAIRDRRGYRILLENGAPRMMATMTLVHEMTHIWQYLNWDERQILQQYGKEANLEIYEGMAKWVEIQYAYLLNEVETGKREELITLSRDDEYGRGFRKYLERYPLSTGRLSGLGTPFDDPHNPL